MTDQQQDEVSPDHFIDCLLGYMKTSALKAALGPTAVHPVAKAGPSRSRCRPSPAKHSCSRSEPLV